ncbi:MAG: ABC transporter substrate-binding protein [Actinomycetota bacterium]
MNQRKKMVIAAMLIALAATACGTRVDKAAFYRALAASGQQGTGGTNGTTSGGSVAAGPSQAPGTTVQGVNNPSGSSGGSTTGGSSTGTASGASAASLGVSTAPVGNTVLVGLNIPLTGAAPVPPTFQDAIDVAQSYLNSNGGIYGRQVKFLVEDDQYDPSTGLAVCRKLAGENVLFAVGHTMPTIEQECTDFYNTKKIPYIMRGIPEATLANRPFAYFATPSDDFQSRLLADYVVKNLGGKTKVSDIVTENDQPVSKVDYTNEIKRLGGKFGNAYNSAPRQSDWGPIITKLKADNAGIVFLNIAPVDAISIAVQAKNNYSYHPVWVGEGTHWNYNLSMQSAGAALDGAVVFSPWASVDTAAANDYKAAYAKYKPGKTPDDLGLIIWGYANMIKQALLGAGQNLTRAAFVDAMNRLNFSSAYWNPIRYTTTNHVGPRDVCVFQGNGSSQRWVQISGFTGSF